MFTGLSTTLNGVFISIRIQRVNKVIRKKIFVLKHVFIEKKFWGSGSVNKLNTEQFSKIDNFQAKFWKFQNALAPSILKIGEF